MQLPFQIMLITDDGPELVARVTRALSGPRSLPVAVQLRRKRAPEPELLSDARALRALTRAHGDRLLINGSLALAEAVEADGVHLPAHGMSVATALAQAPAGRLLGVSCHTKDEVLGAAAAGASYALLSPIHAVPGKAPPIGVAGFAAVARLTRLPLLALGGVTLHDVSPLRAAGAAGCAVMRGVLSAPDPGDALAQLCARFQAGPG